ncbi:MAG: hypothetical protein AB8G99_06305 [Planctomycetaceae bacterium]
MPIRSTLAVITLVLLTHSSASAQGNFLRGLENQGRQYVQDRLRASTPQYYKPTPQSGQGTDRPRSMSPSSVPSEGGRGSGGRDRIFNPGGDGFLLPGNGGGNTQPVNPRFRNPQMPGGQYYYPGDQQIYPGTQPFPSRSFPGGSTTYPSSMAPPSPVRTSQYVVIRVPQSVSGSLYYTLSSGTRNYGFTISGGQEQRFQVSNEWSISYNDGTQQRRYRLLGGKTYTLKKIEGNRWQLYSVRAAGS